MPPHATLVFNTLLRTLYKDINTFVNFFSHDEVSSTIGVTSIVTSTENPSTTNLKDHIIATHIISSTTVNPSIMKEQYHTLYLLPTVENPSTTIYSEQYHTSSTITTPFGLDEVTMTSTKEKFVPDMPTKTKGTMMDITDNDTTDIKNMQVQGEHSMTVRLREIIAWVLMALFATLCSGLLTINITVACIRKRRQASLRVNEDDANVHEMDGYPNFEVTKTMHADGRDTATTDYEIHGNPCYEATKVAETTDMEENLYEVM